MYEHWILPVNMPSEEKASVLVINQSSLDFKHLQNPAYITARSPSFFSGRSELRAGKMLRVAGNEVIT